MSITLNAIYKDGAFLPVQNGEKLNAAENTEVELTVHDPYVLPPTAKNDEEREGAWRELRESWDRHPLAPDAQRLTRDELHERMIVAVCVEGGVTRLYTEDFDASLLKAIGVEIVNPF